VNQRPKSYNRTISAIKRQRTAKLAKIAARSIYLKRKGQSELLANYMCDEFVALGGVYTKFLQGVLLRSEIMRKWHNPKRTNIFENLDTELIDLPALLKRELPKNRLAEIAQIQPQPFAAGSFGQVYYGLLRDGTPIIIKALRPLIRETLRYDLRLLGMFARSFFIKLYPNMQINVDDAINDFKNSTLHETDYVFEANFANELYEHYKDHPKFIIPKTYLDLCTPNLIVQEYLGGISVAQLLKLKEQGIDPAAYIDEQLGSDLNEQMITLGYELLYGIFTLPRIQGDPHPGNIKVLADNKIGLIDFGIAAPAPKEKSSFFGLIEEFEKVYHDAVDIEGLFGQFIRFFVSDLYRALKRLSELQVQNEDTPDLTKSLSKVAHQAFEKQAGPLDANTLRKQNKNILTVINSVVNKQNRFGFIVTIQSSEMLRAAQSYIATVESLGIQDDVLPVVFTSVIERLRAEMPELTQDDANTMSVGHAVEIITDWLERIADRDPVLFSSLIRRINVGRKELKQRAATKAPKAKTEVTERA